MNDIDIYRKASGIRFRSVQLPFFTPKTSFKSTSMTQTPLPILPIPAITPRFVTAFLGKSHAQLTLQLFTV